MKRKISTLPEFDRRSKRLTKKFRSLRSEISKLASQILMNHRLGQPLGAGLYKIRLASASKGGGRSGGFRVITYYVEQTAEGEIVYLVTIYDKSEAASIEKDELLALLRRELPGSPNVA